MEIYDGNLQLGSLNQALLAWKRIYNTLPIRPWGCTPAEYLGQCHPEMAHLLSHMY